VVQHVSRCSSTLVVGPGRACYCWGAVALVFRMPPALCSPEQFDDRRRRTPGDSQIGPFESNCTVSIGGRSSLSFSKLEIGCCVYVGLSVFAAGFRLGFSWVGFNSHRPCFRHWNVKRKGSDLAWRRPGFCEIDCCDPSQFKVWAAADVHKAVDLVNAAAARHEAGTFPRARLKELITACGLKPNSAGLLAAMDLRPNRNRRVVHAFN